MVSVTAAVYLIKSKPINNKERLNFGGFQNFKVFFKHIINKSQKILEYIYLKKKRFNLININTSEI